VRWLWLIFKISWPWIHKKTNVTKIPRDRTLTISVVFFGGIKYVFLHSLWCLNTTAKTSSIYNTMAQKLYPTLLYKTYGYVSLLHKTYIYSTFLHKTCEYMGFRHKTYIYSTLLHKTSLCTHLCFTEPKYTSSKFIFVIPLSLNSYSFVQ